MSGSIQLLRHGTAHQGPVGEEVIREEFFISKEKVLEWQEDCSQGQENKSCLQGPWLDSDTGGTLSAQCRGLHPLPIMFHCVLELEPGVRHCY